MKKRLGETNVNRFGSIMTIVNYNNANSLCVEFEQGNHVYTTYKDFKSGNVKNIYDRSVYGVGYIGLGYYKPTVNKKKTKEYKAWSSMMQRCYDLKRHKDRPTYKGCKVVEEWHNFQVFAKWYNDNYYEVEGQKMCLDKDIIIKGNKIYSPETCIFVPKSINSLIVKNDSVRGNYPIGISLHKATKKYQAKCKNSFGKDIYIGIFGTLEEAFVEYKKYKESIIKEVANNYIDRIPEQLYNALMKYKVEIDD